MVSGFRIYLNDVSKLFPENMKGTNLEGAEDLSLATYFWWPDIDDSRLSGDSHHFLGVQRLFSITVPPLSADHFS